MPHCLKCGATVTNNDSFCPSCGATQGPPMTAPPSATQSGLAENVAGLLCYAFGWVTGLIFYLTDKRPYVRFHAAQSIVVFGGLHIASFVLGMFFGMRILAGGLAGFSMGYMLYRLLHLFIFVLWILLMIKAYQGERFRVPFAADFAESMFGKS